MSHELCVQSAEFLVILDSVLSTLHLILGTFLCEPQRSFGTFSSVIR
jgi:hypothetical protein